MPSNPCSSCLHTLPQRCLTPRTLTPLHCTLPFLLPTGRELMAEMAAKRERERQRFADLEADVTGRGAQTVGGQPPGMACSTLLLLAPCCAAWVHVWGAVSGSQGQLHICSWLLVLRRPLTGVCRRPTQL